MLWHGMAMHGTRTLCETDAQCAVSEFQEAMSCRTASCSDLIGGSMAFNGPSMVSSLDFQVCSCSFRIFNEFNEFVVQVSRNEIKNEFEGEDHATLRFIALPTCKAAEKFQEMQGFGIEYDTYNLYIYIYIHTYTDYTYALYIYITHILRKPAGKLASCYLRTK